MIQKAVASLVENIKRVEMQLGSDIEFESKRVTEIEGKYSRLEKRMQKMESELNVLRSEVAYQHVDINKSERLSRRNNVRIVGIPESPTENCVTVVEEILKEKFGMAVKVERAHRDGKSVQDRSRHIMFKTLSYRDKIDVMRNQRLKLAKESYYMTDDLTREDLTEKRKWSKAAQDLYKNNVKLRFFAGKWRSTGGAPYDFTTLE
eukprot:XP_011668834.1 PREDICTED: uncharacterized protein LOC105440425 [Strongylocentrotus purpuratus]